jgi:hypothetical protein
VETWRIDLVSYAALQIDALHMQIYCLLNHWEILWQRSTHKVQKTSLSNHVIVDFQEMMVQEKNEMLGVLPSNIYNVDQTNTPYFILNGV